MSRKGLSRYLGLSLKGVTYLSLILSIVALLGIIIYILVDGMGYLTWDFLFGPYRAPDQISIWPAIVGTVELLLIALALGLPIGIGSAIFLSEYSKSESKLVKAIRLATETLSGIPSIVYGLFGYLVFLVGVGWGYSLLGGGLTLFLMILPLIVRSVEEALVSVPKSLREASLALGAQKSRTVFKVVLPSASSGIVTGCILASGRVISESAVLLLTIGMVVNKVPGDMLSAGTSLALDIYYFSNFGMPEEAAATSVVLLLLVIFINLLALLAERLLRGKGYGKA